MSEKIKKMSELIAMKTKGSLASVHMDFAGLIRLGETNEERLENFFSLIDLSCISGANIMIPTFSYSYPKNQIYDILNTPSSVGFVTEFLRKKFSSYRTADPLFSYILPRREESPHFEVKDSESFGEDSLIAELFNLNGYICSIGDVFHNSPTEIHYLEKLMKVEYRTNKLFSGQTIDKNGLVHKNDSNFYCRDLNYDLGSDLTRLEKDLKSAGLVEKWFVDGLEFEIEAIKIQDMYSFLQAKIKEDHFYVCSNPTVKSENFTDRRKKWSQTK
ncbi:hypothetical protein A9Q84_05350 [Halobacteriovorax marinus]|uniref:Aminoglycoside N(3)-acetyltransferase n=1 Tax=Halobacteriovorax marinus TaxID=97084 RepID=A0A1Y5FAW7_9BACT|nr:hypothetical protein A9Q84_05350 [Halobacteriovorax marinus]